MLLADQVVAPLVGGTAGGAGIVGTAGGGVVVATMVHGWPVPRPPLLCAGSAPCVHQLAL
jgi:hypothetical protein